MGFDSLIGQSNLKARLGKAILNLPGHAFVFIGPDGIGKTAFAREFAKALLCEHPDENGGCGHCHGCQYFISGAHPDYKELLLKEKEKNIKTDVIRKTICGDISMMPQISTRKVYFIDADDVNEQGQNTLLKTLEEPPEYAVLILAVSAAQNLIPTILSRVIHIPFQRNTTEEIERILIARGADKEAPIRFLSKFSDGIPGVAIHFLESEVFANQREETISKTMQLPQASRSDLLIDYYSFFESNKTQVDDILGIMGTWIRDLTVYAACGEAAELVNEDRRQEIRKSCPVGEHRIRALANAAGIIQTARRGIALNSSFENCVCNMLLQLRKELNNA